VFRTLESKPASLNAILTGLKIEDFTMKMWSGLALITSFTNRRVWLRTALLLSLGRNLSTGKTEVSKRYKPVD
jgi:hypothetical protein